MALIPFTMLLRPPSDMLIATTSEFLNELKTVFIYRCEVEYSISSDIIESAPQRVKARELACAKFKKLYEENPEAFSYAPEEDMFMVFASFRGSPQFLRLEEP